MEKKSSLSQEDRIKGIEIIEEGLIADLQKNGFVDIRHSSDLLKRTINLKIIDISLHWIPKIDNKYGSKEMLIRALSKAARPFDGTILIQTFDNPESSFYLRWAVGNTIASTNVERVESWLLKKIDEGIYAKENEMLVYALVRYFPYDIAIKYLRKVFPLYPLHAAGAIAKIGTIEDLKFLQAEIDNWPKSQKTEIKKSIKKLEARLDKK